MQASTQRMYTRQLQLYIMVPAYSFSGKSKLCTLLRTLLLEGIFPKGFPKVGEYDYVLSLGVICSIGWCHHSHRDVTLAISLYPMCTISVRPDLIQASSKQGPFPRNKNCGCGWTFCWVPCRRLVREHYCTSFIFHVKNVQQKENNDGTFFNHFRPPSTRNKSLLRYWESNSWQQYE